MSDAYTGLSIRLEDVDQLMRAHAAVGGVRKGRRRDVEALNRAGLLLVCAHFQGFLEDLFVEAASYIAPTINADAVTRGFGNPWPKQIDDLFLVLNIPKLSRSVKWKKASNAEVRNQIKLLIESRNSLAHGATNLKVGKSELNRRRKYVEGFAKVADSKVADAIESSTGKRPW